MTEKSTIIKKFGVLSVAKFSAVLGLIWGLIYGIIIFVIGTSYMGALAGVGGLILAIIGGAIIGFIAGAITAFIYNLVLGFIGGIEMDLDILD
ncbi:MAG: hypothetical protein JXA44_00830 [Methanospirillaceae archaeon]|nr:hypothetical protein [Methanospirillaceae archaeon]